jgi:hypothetical protein
MSFRALYPFSGTIMLIGLAAWFYGIVQASPLMFVEGVFLIWLGFVITMNAWEGNRVEN